MRALWLLSIGGVFLAAEAAFASDYVPNRGDDTWEYQGPFGGRSASVERRSSSWGLISEFGGLGKQWVWSRDGSERVYLWNGARRRVELFAIFDAPVGNSNLVSVDPCNTGVVRLAARGETVTVPAGSFSDTVRLDLQPSCADGGVRKIWFAKDVGVIRWEEDSFTGPRIYNLVRAKVGGVSYPKSPSGFSVKGTFPTLDVAYNPLSLAPLPLRVRADLEVKNGTTQSRLFTFPSGQEFDIEVIDGNGNVVSRWSRGKAFTQAIVQRTLKPGESFNFSGVVALQTDEGAVVPAGQYRLKILLTDTSRSWSSSAALRIFQVEPPLPIN